MARIDLLLVVLVILSQAVLAGILSQPKLAAPQFPLKTNGSFIVDSSNHRVKLACVNWYGAHMQRYVVDGLDTQPLDTITHRIQSLGFNCVRLVYSLDLLYLNPTVPSTALSANKNLVGLSAIEIFQRVVASLSAKGIFTILNNHISKAGWCCSETDGEGLWWTKLYSEDRWLQSLSTITKMFKQDPYVIGIDLRNELRRSNGNTPSWGDNNHLTDWHRAATVAGNTVLSVNPNLLIFVEGLSYATDLSKLTSPLVTLSTPNKLVYSGHLYNWSWGVNWANFTYEQFKFKFNQTQTYVRSKGIPFWLGEFGTNTKDTYWNYLIQYLKEFNLDWAYWALDGYQGTPDKDETYGILKSNWLDVRYPWMMTDLATIQQ